MEGIYKEDGNPLKIRNGFVSNSSSASFIIDVPFKTKKSFYEFAADILLDRYYLKQFYNAKIDYYKKYTRTDDGNSYCGDMVERYEDLLNRVNDRDYSEHNMIADYIEMDDIEVSECGEFVRLYLHTTMHNYYNDLPYLIKELVLYNAFEGGDNVVCRIISEQSEGE